MSLYIEQSWKLTLRGRHGGVRNRARRGEYLATSKSLTQPPILLLSMTLSQFHTFCLVQPHVDSPCDSISSARLQVLPPHLVSSISNITMGVITLASKPLTRCPYNPLIPARGDGIREDILETVEIQVIQCGGTEEVFKEIVPAASSRKGVKRQHLQRLNGDVHDDKLKQSVSTCLHESSDAFHVSVTSVAHLQRGQ